MNTTSQKIFFVRAMMVLLVMLVSVTAGAETKSWALWDKGNFTLYFVRDNVAHKKNETYEGRKISQVWKIADNNDTKIVSTEQKARWVNAVKDKCTTVVFDESFSAARPVNCRDWFNGFSKLTTIKNLQYLNTSEVTSMNKMFYNCKALTTLDLSNFDTQNVTDMNYMFYNCKALTTLDLSNFDAQNVTDISYMFYGCSSLETLNMSGFKAEKLKKMTNLFTGCSALKTLDMSEFNVGTVTSLSNLFNKCSALKELDLTSFNTENVKNMSSMFSGCSALEVLDLTSFRNSYIKFNKIYVSNMKDMFNGCRSLSSIYIDGEKWQTVQKGGNKIFSECNSLVGQDGTTIASYNIKKNPLQYAHAGAGGLMKLKVGYMLGGTNVKFYIGEEHVVSAEKDATVTVKVNVPEGNTLTNLTAKRGETDVALHDDGNNTFHFTMPEGPVTVTPTFSKLYTLSGEGVSFKVGEEAVTQAMAGVTVEFSVEAPAGQEVDEMTVMQGETPIEFTDHEDGTGQFMMPAGNVTVKATFKDIVVPVTPGTYQLTTEDENLKFYMGNEVVTEATTGEVVHVECTVSEDKKLKGITAKWGETPLEVSFDDDIYFEMPAGPVTVTATYADLHKLESGTLVDEETGERENDYVDFYDELYNTITEAYTGDRVYLDIDFLAIDGGKYFAGQYVAKYKVGDVEQTLTVLKEDAQYYFIMPDYDVTVTAELKDQETLTIPLLTDAPVNLEGLELGELTSLMMQWEGYLVKTESEPDNAFPFHMRYYYDFNGDGNMDAVMIRTITTLDGASTYEIQRLEGAALLGANYCATLKSPGYPVKYKDVLMKFGETLPTIYGVFLYDGLENRNTLLTYNGKTVDVGFPDRLLYKDGDWNTICLPFDLTVAGSPLDGAGVTVKTLKGASLENGTLTLTFTEGSETELKAGVPYLIKWDKPDGYEPYDYDPAHTCYDLYAPLFRNVTLDNTLNPVMITDLISFNGTYAVWEYKKDAPSVLLVGEKSSLYYPTDYSYLYPFRAYFQLLGSIKAVDPSLGGSIKSMVMDFGDEGTTGVTSMEDGRGLMDEGWYTLQGVKLDAKPSVKGIYIYNGKKVAVQ